MTEKQDEEEVQQDRYWNTAVVWESTYLPSQQADTYIIGCSHSYYSRNQNLYEVCMRRIYISGTSNTFTIRSSTATSGKSFRICVAIRGLTQGTMLLVSRRDKLTVINGTEDG